MAHTINDELSEYLDQTAAARAAHIEQRQKLEAALPEIADEAAAALKAANLDIPVFFCVPAPENTGNSLMSFATPGDPPLEDWQRVSRIVETIIGSRIGCDGLRSRSLACIAAGMPKVGGADLVGPESTRNRPALTFF